MGPVGHREAGRRCRLTIPPHRAGMHQIPSPLKQPVKPPIEDEGPEKSKISAGVFRLARAYCSHRTAGCRRDGGRDVQSRLRNLY